MTAKEHDSEPGPPNPLSNVIDTFLPGAKLMNNWSFSPNNKEVQLTRTDEERCPEVDRINSKELRDTVFISSNNDSEMSSVPGSSCEPESDTHCSEEESADDDTIPKKAVKSSCTKSLLASLVIIALIILSSFLVFYFKASKKSKTVEAELSDIIVPTKAPTDLPTKRPSLVPTRFPTRRPTIKLTPFPTIWPTERPTSLSTTRPTERPTPLPTKQPTESPTRKATLAPTKAPIRPTTAPVVHILPVETLVSRFYVIGDLPYDERQRQRLIYHVENLPEDAEFLIHIGDLRSAKEMNECILSEYEGVAEILKKSHVPTFIIPGDNEYNDCPNANEGLGFFRNVFGQLENNWNAPFTVHRNEDRPENFYFVHKNVLYIGLNLIGGAIHDDDEWISRLSSQFNWVKALTETYVLGSAKEAGSVVIFGHAIPTHEHRQFFWPLESFYKDELKERIPMIYIHGDGHYFEFQDRFLGTNFPRLMVEGGSYEPPLQVTMTMPSIMVEDLFARNIFSYNRML